MKAIESMRNWLGIRKAKGPFAALTFVRGKAQYHRNAMDQRFREALTAYLERELLPQVEEAYDSIEGTVAPEYNEERYCGPHSAVRDIYRIEVKFIRKESKDEINAQIYRDTTTGDFRPRHKNIPLVLWTRREREEQAAFNSSIETIVQAIKNGKKDGLTCPRCSSSLKLIDNPDLFDLSCQAGCFNYNYHRDRMTGEFLHGHFFSKERETEEPNHAQQDTR